MERMAGVDAGYLYLETPTMHMHTLKIAVLEPSEEPFSTDRLAEELLARLERLPPLARRVLPAPLGLHHPLWITDRRIDLEHHLRSHPVPEPGGMRGLEKLVGQVAGTPLDRSRPLWEMHVCEPFGDGRFAVITKMHHALADGVAANALLANVIDDPDAVEALDPESAADGPGGAPPVRERPPSWLRQLLGALLDAVAQLRALPGLLARTLRALASVVRRRRGSDVTVPRPVLDVPRTRFNGPLTPRRSFATSSLPVPELKAVQKAHGVTMNDVVLALVGGALRRWLLGLGELPERSLVAGVPVATDPPGAGPRLGGNRVSNLFTSLATDVADPAERLRQISRTTRESKAVQQTLGPDMLVDWVQFAPPGPVSAATALYSRLRGAARHPPPFNVVVSNVRGPQEPATIAGARLADLYSVGPILEGMGLNVTAWSYVDRMNFSFLTCPDLVPDLEALVAELPHALQELRQEVGTR